MNANVLRKDEMRRLRQSLGLTMAEAAKRAGFKSPQYWNNIENGRRPSVKAETLYAIAKVLGTTMESLLSLDEPTASTPRRKPHQK